MEIQEKVDLAERTTLGVGGVTRFFAEIKNEADVPLALAWAEARQLPVFVLGGGSNVLISDAGFAGLTLHLGVRGRRGMDDGRLEVAAGETWDDVVADCVHRGWAGVECLSGIPGTAGATPVQNVGAYGQEVAATIESVRAWDRQRAQWTELAAGECGFGYRCSRFNQQDRERFVIVAVQYRLQPGGTASLRYPELQRRVPANPSLQQVRDAVREIRRGKAMLLDTKEPESHSAGSFFKNPVVPSATAARIARQAGAELPQFPAGEGQVKLSAAWLMEHAGFTRGYRPEPGRVGLSRRHVLALVNYAGGTAADLVGLARQIRAGVQQRFGVWLTPEPAQIGFAPGDEV